MATTKDNNKKTMDISKPGKTSPDTSGRPVLVTHRPIVQDPMVNQPDAEEAQYTAEPKKEVVSHTTKVLQPVDTTLKRDDTEEAKPANDETESEDSAVVDAVVEKAATDTKLREGELSPEDKAKKEKIEKLIADKTYFVPIGQAARRRNRRVALIIGIITTLLITIFMLASLSIIKLPFNLQLFGVKLYNSAQYVAGNKSVSDGQIDIIDTSPDALMKTRVSNLQTALVQYKESNKAIPTIDELNSFPIKEALKKFHPELEFKDAYDKDLQFVSEPAQGKVAYITFDTQGHSCTKECTHAKLIYTDKSSVEYMREIKGIYEYLSKPN
jgi:hypothetical protein